MQIVVVNREGDKLAQFYAVGHFYFLAELVHPRVYRTPGEAPNNFDNLPIISFTQLLRDFFPNWRPSVDPAPGSRFYFFRRGIMK